MEQKGQWQRAALRLNAAAEDGAWYRLPLVSFTIWATWPSCSILRAHFFGMRRSLLREARRQRNRLCVREGDCLAICCSCGGRHD